MAGMLLSNVIMYFLILTTAATLNAHGLKDIETATQAAETLRPLHLHKSGINHPEASCFNTNYLRC
jgi:hypothetical protein